MLAVAHQAGVAVVGLLACAQCRDESLIGRRQSRVLLGVDVISQFAQLQLVLLAVALDLLVVADQLLGVGAFGVKNLLKVADILTGQRVGDEQCFLRAR